MLSCDAVLIHYGDQGPTVEVANAAVAWASRVVVVSNDLSQRPSQLADSVRWAVPDRNLGFGGGLNFGANFCDAEVLCALNNDIELSTAVVQKCLEVMQLNPRVAISGPSLVYSDGSVQSSVGSFSPIIKWPKANNSIPEAPVECDWITGAVMFIKREYWLTWPMDETYFLGCEDADYCLRAAKNGMSVMLVPASGAVHYGSKVISGPRWNYYYARNHIWFCRDCFSRLRAAALVSWLVLRCLRVVVADLSKRRGFQRSISTIRGIRDGFLPKPPYGNGPLVGEPIPARWLDW